MNRTKIEYLLSQSVQRTREADPREAAIWQKLAATWMILSRPMERPAFLPCRATARDRVLPRRR